MFLNCYKIRIQKFALCYCCFSNPCYHLLYSVTLQCLVLQIHSKYINEAKQSLFFIDLHIIYWGMLSIIFEIGYVLFMQSSLLIDIQNIRTLKYHYVCYVIYENYMQLELKHKGIYHLNGSLDTLLVYPPKIFNLFHGHPQSVS